MAPRLVVLGWDSATFDVIDPLVDEGRLPVLKELMEQGSRAPLRSTWPPMTDCAWTSAFTGRNPGAHGIFGSWYRAPGEYGCRYFSSRDRRSPTVWELASDVRFLVWNVPMTFPPSAINGVMVAGYGAPPGARICEPAGFQAELEERWPLEDLLDRAPHGSLGTFRDELIRGLEVQAEALVWAADRSEAECVVAVWPHVDRAQHFFWRFRDTDHEFAGVVDDVYEAIDRATGAIYGAFSDSDVLVVSDHGAGPLRGDVNMGSWLASQGYATYGKPERSVVAEAAWNLPPAVRRLGRRLAPGLARRAMGARLSSQLAPFDWGSTRAFLGVHSDLWLNLEDREPQGTVGASEAPGLVQELSEAIAAITDEEGRPVFAGCHRRDEIYSGPAVELAPDLMLDPWSQGYRVAPGRDSTDEVIVRPEPLAGVREAWSSDHRPLGILVASGPRLTSARPEELSLYDVCPTMLGLLGRPLPSDLDGRAATGVMEESFLRENPIRTGGASEERSAHGDYSDEEAEAVAAHLKDLGYIE